MPFLHAAAKNGYDEMVRYLMMQKLVDYDGVDKDNNTALHYAVFHGHRRIVAILAAHGAQLDMQDRQGLTPLLHATWKNDVITMRLLLHYGASCDVPDENGRTALHYAARAGSGESLGVLVPKCQDLHVIDNRGLTALHHAAGAGHKEAIQVLLAAGARRGHRDHDSRTPLALAMQMEQGGQIYRLLR
jgi:ankyrin repeat protein